MIDASSESLGAFLKTQGVQTAVNSADAIQTAGAILKPASPIEPINNAVTNTTDSLEKFTNLLESVNKLFNSPLISGIMNKGVDRKTATPQNAEFREVPAPVDRGLPDSAPLPPPKPAPTPEIDKREKAEMFYNALLKAVEEMKNKDPERTIEQVYEELAQEIVKEELINQFEVLV